MADDPDTNPVSEAPCSTSTQVEPLPRPTEESSADLPLMQWTSVQEHLRNSRWTQLLHDAHVREYLQHRCPVCYQWLATTTSIKYHLTVQHPEWSTAQPAALKLLQGFRRHMVVPCRYCLQRNINKDRHWKQCHVLHICAFLAVHHGRDGERPYGPGCSGAPVLDAGGTTEAGTRGGQVLSTGRERDDQKAEAGHAKQGQRKGQEQQGQEQRLPKDRPTKPDSGSIERCVERGLHRWFRRADDQSLAPHSGQPPSSGVRSRMDDSSCEHLGAAGSEARADSCLSSPGLGDLPLCSLRTGGNGAGALRGCRQMENNEGGGTGQIDLLLEARHVQAAPDLTAPTIERGRSRTKEAMDRAASLNWVDERQHWRHLHWSPAQQRLEVDQSLRPIPTEDLLTQLVQVRKAVTEESLLRFKSVKKLSKEVTADWIQFQICVSLRPEGGAIWSTLNQVSGTTTLDGRGGILLHEVIRCDEGGWVSIDDLVRMEVLWTAGSSDITESANVRDRDQRMWHHGTRWAVD